MPTAFITGVNGFVGGHLSALLQGQGWKVAGCDVTAACAVAGVTYAGFDILDTGALGAAIEASGADQVYHLAGLSFPPDADASPRRAIEVNLLGVVSLLDAVRRARPLAPTLLVGSAKEYGAVPAGEPYREAAQPAPDSFYGISKYAAELLGLQYGRQFGLDARFSRSFNHTGPGQSPRFVCSDWARQAAEVRLGRREPRLEVGDLSPEIDFSDVRDVVRAYQAILTKGGRGEVYNVCSGALVPLRRVLDHLVARAGREVAIVSAPARMRGHATAPRLAADNTKLRATGWRPEVPLERTLDDLFDWWIDALQRG